MPGGLNIGITWAENGFFEEARRVVRETPVKDYAIQVEESIAVAEHRPGDALRLAERVFATLQPGTGHLQMTMMTADALVELGRVREAISRLEASTAYRMRAADIDGGYRWISARAQLARLYQTVGEEAKARAIEDHLVKLLAVADPDHPLLLDLKSRIAARRRVITGTAAIRASAAGGVLGCVALAGCLHVAWRRSRL
jgi:hypothetical protein